MRVPLMTGFPIITPGSETINFSAMTILLFGATDFASTFMAKRSLVEAAGIEPASENLPAELLHT